MELWVKLKIPIHDICRAWSHCKDMTYMTVTKLSDEGRMPHPPLLKWWLSLITTPTSIMHSVILLGECRTLWSEHIIFLLCCLMTLCVWQMYVCMCVCMQAPGGASAAGAQQGAQPQPPLQQEDWQVGSLFPPPACVCVWEIVNWLWEEPCVHVHPLQRMFVACFILSDGLSKLDLGAVGCLPHLFLFKPSRNGGGT